MKRTIGPARIPRNLLGNFSRQPNATVDFSAGRKTEISHTVVVPRSLLPSPSRVNPAGIRISLNFPTYFLFFFFHFHPLLVREYDLSRERRNEVSRCHEIFPRRDQYVYIFRVRFETLPDTRRKRRALVGNRSTRVFSIEYDLPLIANQG